jgi:putative adenylate-forming enzyme
MPLQVGLIASLLRERSRLASHERWTRDELGAYQAKKVAELRAFAVARSRLYAELYRGLEAAPLATLPTLTKARLMERFDDLVTDPDVRLEDVERHVETSLVTDVFRGRYRVAATGGTTGRRGIFLADPDEWTSVLASYARAYAWAGLNPSLTNRIRMAIVSSRNPTHQSSIVGATVASPFVPTLRLDAAARIADIVRALNEFRPNALVGYASVLRQLALEQESARLAIAPRAVLSASEVLADETRVLIGAAFGVRATNVYAATETAGVASECRAGHLHQYEDLVVAEIVDGDNRRVPPGELGAKLLVTVLFSRTMPLIRYELSDQVAASLEPNQPDLPFATLAGIEGRQEEILDLAGVAVHPNVFHAALERLPVAGWQVVDEGGWLRVLLADADGVDPGSVERAVRASLGGVGVGGIRIIVELVDAIPRTRLGKAPLIRRSVRHPGADPAR